MPTQSKKSLVLNCFHTQKIDTDNVCGHCVTGQYNIKRDLSMCHTCLPEGVECTSKDVSVWSGHWIKENKDGTLAVYKWRNV